MLAVLAQPGLDNTGMYLVLVLMKFGLDAAVIYLCTRKLYTSFLSMCSLSIFLADFVMVFLVASMLFLGPETCHKSLCLIFANASVTYGALPLPMMCLGLLDYVLEGTYLGRQSAKRKFIRNSVWLLLMWMIAIYLSFGSVDSDLKGKSFEIENKALVCEVEESALITYSILVIFSAVILILLPFWSKIPQWIIQAHRLSEARDEPDNQSSDLLFTSTTYAETKSSGEYYLEEPIQPGPPLWLTFTLGFALCWMPYLICSVVCLILDIGVPACITVNLLWLECMNSLLVGLVFRINSKTQGPYSNLPENICLWQVYWQLSKGTQQQKLQVAVCKPIQLKRTGPPASSVVRAGTYA